MVGVSLYSVLILCISLVRNEATVVSVNTTPQFEFEYLTEYGIDIQNESRIYFGVVTCGNASIAFYEQHNPPIIKDYFVIPAPPDCYSSQPRRYGMIWSEQLIQLVAGDSSMITRLGLENRSINYLAVATGYGNSGQWMFDAQHLENKPSNGTSNEEPTTGTSNGEHATGTSNGDPTAGTSNEDPTAGTSNGDPTAGTLNEDPTAGTSNGDPTAGTLNEDPTAGTLNEDPTAGTSNGDPTAGTLNEDPTAGTSNEDPTAGTSNGDPTAGNLKGGTSSENFEGETVTENLNEETATENLNVKPSSENLNIESSSYFDSSDENGDTMLVRRSFATSASLMMSSFIDHSPVITSYMGQYSVDSESNDVGKTTQDQVYMTSMARSNIMTSSSDMYAITSSTDFVMTSSDTIVEGYITSSTETTTEAEQCDLLCRCVGNGELNLNMSMAVVEIKKKLFINVSQLSKTVRKKISVVDNRPSSVSVGVFGIAILVSTLFLITVPDIFSVVVYFYRKL